LHCFLKPPVPPVVDVFDHAAGFGIPSCNVVLHTKF